MWIVKRGRHGSKDAPYLDNMADLMYSPDEIIALLRSQAIAVGGTEAICFGVKRRWWRIELNTVVHIRPDQSTAGVRAAAIDAFMTICKPCVRQAKDGAIEIKSGDYALQPQFCLVTLLRDLNNEVCAVNAVITRCSDLEAARPQLQKMQKLIRRGSDTH